MMLNIRQCTVLATKNYLVLNVNYIGAEKLCSKASLVLSEMFGFLQSAITEGTYIIAFYCDLNLHYLVTERVF